jgi:hypothetical protein
MDTTIVDNKHINLNNLQDFDHLKMDKILFKKMLLIYNALEDGWTVKRKDKSYVFIKKHNNIKQVLDDEYLIHFVTDNLDMNKLFV